MTLCGCGWVIEALRGPGATRFRNFEVKDSVHSESFWGHAALLSKLFINPAVSWDDLAWLRRHWDLPLVLKGITHKEDAREAIRQGVDGVIVSNHGGRQLDGLPASIELLPPIAEEVAGRIRILLDGRVRCGRVSSISRKEIFLVEKPRSKAWNGRCVGNA